MNMSNIGINEVMQAVGGGHYSGFCLECGFEQDGCEPDARNYKCEYCGADEVFGAEEILLNYEFHAFHIKQKINKKLIQ